MLGLIVPLLNSQHPRIVHDILIAMGYMSEEFAPEIQQNYGATILGFIELNIVHAYPKVQYRAVQCL